MTDKEQACVVVLTTCPDKAVAQRIAEALIRESVAACVNVLPAVDSYFKWENKMSHAQETLLLTKTSHRRLAAVEASIRRLHPYEVPEIIALPIVAGGSDYLAWILSSVGG